MNKPLIAFWMLFLTSAVFVSAAPAGESVLDVRQAIQNVYDQAAVLLDNKDFDGVVKLTAPDAVFFYADGLKQTVSEWATAAEKNPAGKKTAHIRFELGAIRWKVNDAVVNVKEVYTYTLAGAQEAGHTYQATILWRVNFVKTEQGWQPRRFNQLSCQIKKDGIQISLIRAPRK